MNVTAGAAAGPAGRQHRRVRIPQHHKAGFRLERLLVAAGAAAGRVGVLHLQRNGRVAFSASVLRIDERGDGGNDAFAAVDDWEPGTRLDQMARQGPASKTPTLHYDDDGTAGV